MAKTKGPLFSEGAAGNFASGAMQFRGGLRGTHAYRPKSTKIINQKAPTEAQAAVRTAYKEILEEWRAFDEQEKAQWDADAIQSGQPMTGWNLYVKSRMPDVLYAPTMPDPNTYTPPTAESITFPGTTWVTDTSYTPPQHDNIIF